MTIKKPTKPQVTLVVYHTGIPWSWYCCLPDGVWLKTGWRNPGLKTRTGAIKNARRTLKKLRLYEVWNISEEIEEE